MNGRFDDGAKIRNENLIQYYTSTKVEGNEKREIS